MDPDELRETRIAAAIQALDPLCGWPLHGPNCTCAEKATAVVDALDALGCDAEIDGSG
jgi:hypothetical protein